MIGLHRCVNTSEGVKMLLVSYAFGRVIVFHPLTFRVLHNTHEHEKATV